ncbi:MAG: DUF4199 domain-containing protein [Bacteroidales bacterium]|uniref:DUF4199 domain-containing protein n=1 Tax=Porphyromonas sp. TaxID=1924944 RepID=UPI002975634B|nr:DUF4199 domain-containing protein [Porphyromonas sp.]MDD7437729.1 DUF4199 domain-containing protein [Bacteroidales bacterium]MDY3066851.1 DUF4199 domain-containing protein [Porphyromonas sp.]
MDWKEEKEPFRKVLDQRRGFFQLAMNEGLSLGLLFVAQAGALLLYRLGIFSTLLLLAAIVGVPIALYLKGIRFRDHHMDGNVGYMPIVGYLSWSYLFALGIGFISYFVVTYILFRDPTFIAMMEESFGLFAEIAKQNGAQYEEAIASIKNITPLRISSTIAIQALFFGLIYIYIIGLFIKRSDK